MEDARKLVLFRRWKLDRSLQGLLKSLAHLALPHELMEGERRAGGATSPHESLNLSEPKCNDGL